VEIQHSIDRELHGFEIVNIVHRVDSFGHAAFTNDPAAFSRDS
jgi:hypothetical protein